MNKTHVSQIGKACFVNELVLVYLENNKYIYQPDEDISFLYFPETAVFSEFQILQNEKITEILMTGREGILGLSSIFSSPLSPILTQVLQGGQALRGDTKSLKRNLDGNGEIRESVFEFVSLLKNQISQKLIRNGFHSIEERLCTGLLMIQDGAGNSNIQITHEKIGISFGVHHPNVTQITKVLRDEKIIYYQKGKKNNPKSSKIGI